MSAMFSGVLLFCEHSPELCFIVIRQRIAAQLKWKMLMYMVYYQIFVIIFPSKTFKKYLLNYLLRNDVVYFMVRKLSEMFHIIFVAKRIICAAVELYG